jgi:hypothetical protein
VHVIHEINRWIPVGYICFGLVALWTAPSRAQQHSPGWDLLRLGLPCFFMAADAVLAGESTIERACKGCGAVLTAGSMVIAGWQRHSHRPQRLRPFVPSPDAGRRQA